jgi:hypothetical protein
VNLVLNGAIGWVVCRSLDRIPVSGSPSVSGDLVGTAFLLPLLVCLIATPLVRAEVRGGRLNGLNPRESSRDFCRVAFSCVESPSASLPPSR